MAGLKTALARLDDDPAGDLLVDALEALAKRGLWSTALQRARAGLRAGADRGDVLMALARGALVCGRADRALKALDELPDGLRQGREAVRLRVHALVAARREEEARREAEAYHLAHPEDTEIGAWVAAWRAEAAVRGSLPLETMPRAMSLLRAGHPRAALRLLRRLELMHPEEEVVVTAVRVATERLRQHEPDLPLDPFSGVVMAIPSDDDAGHAA